MFKLLVLLAVVYTASAQNRPCGQPAIPPYTDNIIGKVVGGNECTRNSWPWQISLRSFGAHSCGGSIISPTVMASQSIWILNAAHCVQGSLASYSVRAGRHTRSGTNEPFEQAASVAQLIPHELYNPSLLSNDISLIRLSTPFTFNNQVSHVCISNTEPAANVNAWLTGWGNVQGTCCDGLLKQALLPIIARSQCGAPTWWGSNITPDMVCAGYASGAQGACNGDSGGPLVVQTAPNTFSQVGTVSWGHRTCNAANKPPVFGNVGYFYNWIANKIGMVEKEQEEMMAKKFHPRLGAAFRAFAKSLEE